MSAPTKQAAISRAICTQSCTAGHSGSLVKRCSARHLRAEQESRRTGPAIPVEQDAASLTAWIAASDVSDEAIEHLDEARAELAESHTRLSPGPVLGDVSRVHRQVQELLHSGRQRARQARELFRIDAELLAHASLLLDDIHHDASARAHGRAAALCAEEAGLLVLPSRSARRPRPPGGKDPAGGGTGAGVLQAVGRPGRRGFECSSRSPVGVLLADQEASAAALLGDASRARRALMDAQEAASGWLVDSGFSVWSCPRPRQALYALSVAIRLRDPDAALQAAEMADAAWASGDPWLYGVWSLIRIGAGTAHVMKNDLDAAAAQLGAVITLDPPFRIATITGYLADMDSLLRQRRFAGAKKAGELREQIRAFTAAACPAARRRQYRLARRIVEPAPGADGRSLVAAAGCGSGPDAAHVVHASR